MTKNGSGGGTYSKHGAVDSSMIAAAATQSEPFPCFKKSVWDDRIIVEIVQRQGASVRA